MLEIKDGKFIVEEWDVRCNRCGQVLRVIPEVREGVIYVCPCNCLSKRNK